MSDSFWNAFFGSLPATLFALGALWASRKNGQKIDTQVAEVVGLKRQIDGQTTALIDAKVLVATADGMQAGKAIGKEQAKTDAVDLAIAVADKQAADQVLRAEGRALGLIKTRRDDDPKEG